MNGVILGCRYDTIGSIAVRRSFRRLPTLRRSVVILQSPGVRVLVSPFDISFLGSRCQDVHSEARDYQGIGHVDLSDSNSSFPIGKVKEICVRLDVPAAATSTGRWSQWSITDIGRHMSLLCELLNKLRRPEELLPKTSLKLPTSVMRAESANERHQLDGNQPACIEAALQAMSKTLRRI